MGFENRKKGDAGNDCLMSVDGTDFLVALRKCKMFRSYKTKKSAFRYEVGLNIKTGDICWLHGGFPAGAMNDHMIFEKALLHELEENERVEADMGYRNSAPLYVKCPGTIYTEEEKKEVQSRVRARHET